MDFSFIYDSILYLLTQFRDVLGSYAWAIIGLTAGFRLLLWPLNNAQTRSMKKMQELQPKIKALQDKYKDRPQEMQQAMMKFYGENKFNPLAGCLPMLIQLPIFIGLYGALISPDFLAVAGNESFFFVESLAKPLYSHSGPALDNSYSIQENDKFVTARKIKVNFTNGKKGEYKVRDTKKVLSVAPQPLIPGEPIQFTVDVRELGEGGFGESFVNRIQSADLMVVNDSSKELEELKLTPQKVAPDNADPAALGWQLGANIDSVFGENSIHMGMLYLILLYTLLTVLYQKVMTPKTSTPQAGPQAMMMKLMPLMFVGFLVFLPIPAGVVLYLVVTMMMMFLQTLWVRFTDDKDEKTAQIKAGSSAEVVDIKPVERIK